MVDDQLSSLYNELELEGFSPSLHLEDGVTSSSDDQAGSSSQVRLDHRTGVVANQYSGSINFPAQVSEYSFKFPELAHHCFHEALFMLMF